MTIIYTGNLPDLLDVIDVIIEAEDTNHDRDFSDWFCIKIEAYNCPGCKKIVEHVTAGPMHMIVVFPTNDCDEILYVAQELIEIDSETNPRIIEFKETFGPCVTFEDAVRFHWID